MSTERALLIDCAGDRLVAVLHAAKEPAAACGVVLVVGGPQYRVGSHRQFVLLARRLADAGVSVLRFDYRGMGDSGGPARDFTDIGDDIRAAVGCLVETQPHVERVVLWGLCDAASANAFYAVGDERIAGQIALNPWVRTAEGEAQAFVRHYYWQRLRDPALWRKIVRLEFGLAASLRDLAAKIGASRGGRRRAGTGEPLKLPQRMRAAQLAFGGRTLLVLSGRDLTAREYEDQVAASADWQRWLGHARVTVRRIEEADHTFSREAWRDQVAQWCADWILEDC